MPLHDWTGRDDWEGMRLHWLAELCRTLKRDLPPGFRSLIRNVATDDELSEVELAILVEQDGRLVTALEVISPRQKDLPVIHEQTATRFAKHLQSGVHLGIIDLYPRPARFAFPRLPAAENGEDILPPMAVSYRVGVAAAQGGRMLAVWQRAMAVGQPLPAMPLPLGPDVLVSVDLDGTYGRAATDSYLDNAGA